MGTINYKPKLEHDRRWFRIVLKNELLAREKFDVPSQFVFTRYDMATQSKIYWLKWLAPFVRMGYWIRQRWWTSGIWFLEKGYLHLPDVGARISFWPKYVRPWKRKEDVNS